VNRAFLRLTAVVLLIQALVGLLGFYLHVRADLNGPAPRWQDNFIEGAPVLAPLLFPNMVLLAGIGMWVLYARLSRSPSAVEQQPEVVPPPP
jgi:hypothetical protein